MNTIKIVQNEEQEVEVFCGEDMIFYWSKDSDWHTMTDEVRNLLDVVGVEYDLVSAEEYYDIDEDEEE